MASLQHYFVRRRIRVREEHQASDVRKPSAMGGLWYCFRLKVRLRLCRRISERRKPCLGGKAVRGLDTYAAVLSEEHRSRRHSPLCRYFGQSRRRPFCDDLNGVFLDDLVISHDMPAHAVRRGLEDNQIAHVPSEAQAQGEYTNENEGQSGYRSDFQAAVLSGARPVPIISHVLLHWFAHHCALEARAYHRAEGNHASQTKKPVAGGMRQASD